MDRLACVNISAFPLQILLRRHPEWRGYPVAVVAEDKPQARILWVNEKAFQKGALPGFRYAAAASLAVDLRAGAVSSGEIEKAVNTLVKSFMRFTPEVESSKEEPGIFWLSGKGLDLLYPSLKRWAGSILAEIKRQNFRASLVAGFARFGTYAVSKARPGVVVFQDPAQEFAAARAVALQNLDMEPELLGMLAKLGIKTVGEFLSLPAAGLRERFGLEAYRLHRMAAGDLSEPLRGYSPAEPIGKKTLLDHPESDAARLLFLVKRLLHPLLAALHGRGEALTELLLRLLTEEKGRREERIRPAAPTLDSVQVLDLVRLRLETIELSAGVIEIELVAEGSPAMPEQLRFFADQRGRDLDAANRALARLRAEFGDQAVVRAKLTDGHLPAARFTWQPLERVKLPRPTEGAKRNLVRRIFPKPISLPSQPRTHHDGWLLLGPAYGAVSKLSGPYLISGGWWNREIHREYYFAETRRGDLLWIYYDRVRRCWFLQGRVE